MKKRLMSAFLSLCMVLTMVPTVAFAVDNEPQVKVRLFHYEYLWNSVTKEWIQSKDMKNTIAELAVTPQADDEGHMESINYAIPTLTGDKVTQGTDDSPQIMVDGQKYSCVGVQIYYTLSGGGRTTETYLWSNLDNNTVTLQYENVNQANIRYMWVPEGKGQEDVQETTNVTFRLYDPADYPNKTVQTLGGDSSMTSRSILKADLEKELTQVEGIEEGALTIDWPVGYPMDIPDALGGCQYYFMKIIDETDTSLVTYIPFEFNWSWQEDGTTQTGSTATITDQVEFSPTLRGNYIYTVDMDTLYDVTPTYFNMLVSGSADSEEQFKQAESKIETPEVAVIEDAKEQETYTFTVQRPTTADMTADEKANSSVQPYLLLKDEEGNLVAKWVCVGYQYDEYYLNGANESSRRLTIPVDDWSKEQTITMKGGDLSYRYETIRIYYQWELDGNTVSYDLNIASSGTSADGQLPQGAKVYLVDNGEGIEAFYASTITNDWIKTSTVMEGAAFSVVPMRTNVQEDDTLTYIGALENAETGETTYYRLTGFSDGTDTYQWGESATMGSTDMKLTAQWEEIETSDYAVDPDDSDFPVLALATQDNSALVSQHKSDSTRWTKNTADDPLELNEDGEVSYKAELSMANAIAILLNGRAIYDEEFAKFEIHVDLDDQLTLVANDDKNIIFSFTSTFLRPVEGTDGNNDKALIKVENGDGSYEDQYFSYTETAKNSRGVTVYTYEFTVPADTLTNDFIICMEWRPTTSGYAYNALTEEMSLETLTAKIEETGKLVETGGYITGVIDLSHAKNQNGNLIITDSQVRSGVQLLLGNDEIKDYCDINNDGYIQVIDFLKAQEWMKAALENLYMGGNKVYSIIQSPEVTIEPVDLTIYMGGDDGYEAVVGDDTGTVSTTNNSLPKPIFTITANDETTNFDGMIFKDNTGKEWIARRIKDVDGEPSDYYSLEANKDNQDPVRVSYIGADGEAHLSDSFDITDAKDLFTTYDVKLYTGDVDITTVTAILNEKTYAVDASGTGTLTVRTVVNTEDNAAVSEVVNEAPDKKLSAGTGLIVAEADTIYTVNDLDIPVPDDTTPSLLFDEIVTEDGVEREAALENKVAEQVETPSNRTRMYQSRYLDLVDASNGNIWLKANKDITVYWAYPTGTDINDDFTLWHFEGLHRDDASGGQSGFDINDLESDTTELKQVNIDKDEYGIYFTVTPGGFSPFVLTWTESSSSSSDDGGGNDGSGGGGSGGGSHDKPEDLNTEDHVAYIIGYPDGSVRPQGNITRAEVATIFFRMLTDEARSENWSQTNSYTDVPFDAWYNNAISTLSNMGIISGYPDGSFRPDAPITRAEFTKIAVGFFDEPGNYVAGTYEDVSENAWYADFIDAAVDLGLIKGYPDGTIRPEATITRAEACTILNRTLGRVPDKDHLLPVDEMNTWPDNSDTSMWYYEQMQEATNSHDYEWIGEGDNQIENWTEKLKDRDWAALELEWSTANDAPGEEVVS